MRIGILFYICVLDFAFAAALCLSLVDWDFGKWFDSVFIDWSSTLGNHFSESAGDVCFLALLRLLFLPLAIFWRTKRARAERSKSAQLARAEVYSDDYASARSLASMTGLSINSPNNDDNDLDDDEAALLIHDSDSVDVRKEKRAAQKKLTAQKAQKLVSFDRHLLKATKSVLFANRVVLGLTFTSLFLCLVFTGIKTVLFRFSASPTSVLFHFQATALSAAVLFMSLELWLARDALAAATQDSGRVIATLHAHALYLDDSVACHWCDGCHTRIDARIAYRCRTCDYDLCLACFRKGNRRQAEGLLRGDGGVKEEAVLDNWTYARKATVFVGQLWVYIALAMVVMLLTSIARLLLPNYQGQILDKVISVDRDGFWHDIKWYIGMSVVIALFGSIQSLCFALASRKMSTAIKDALYKSIIVQDIAFFDGANSGDLTSRLSGDVYAMVYPVQSALATLLSSFIAVFGGLVMCLYTSWRLSVLAFTTIGPIIVIYRVYARWSRQINREIWAAYGDANAKATQALKNIRTVRAFSQELSEVDGFMESTGEALAKGIKDAFMGALTAAMTSYIDLSITVLLLLYGGLQAMNGNSLTIGNLITFQLYWGMINDSYRSLTRVFTQFTQAGGAAQRVISLLDALPDIDPRAGLKMDTIDGDLRIENVRFTYQMRPDDEVLRGIDLHIKSGQVCALVGRSGGGKSTIIHLLMRFYDPTKGRILVDGKDLKTLSALDYRKHIGVVSQETQLFNMTIEENIAYGAGVYTKQQLIDAATQANAHEFIESFDDGYATKCGENGVRLSGGQRQRLALARVLLRKPTILLLDEATSALDAESEAAVQEAIDGLLAGKNCTVVLVAHRLSTVINADNIAVIDKGIIAEQGTHSQLLAKNGIYSKLVGRQVMKQANLINADDPKNNKKNKLKYSLEDLTVDALLDDEDDDQDKEDKTDENGTK